MHYFNANSMHYFRQNSLHYLHYFELLSNTRNFTIQSQIPKMLVSSLVPRFQIPSRKQLSIKLLDNKFQKTHNLLKTDLILLTVLKFLELPVLYDSVSHE